MKLNTLNYISIGIAPITALICAVGILSSNPRLAWAGGLSTLSNVSTVVGKLLQEEENEKLDKLRELYESGQLEEYEEELSSLSEEELAEWIDQL